MNVSVNVQEDGNGGVQGEPRPRLRDLVAAEWIRVRSLRSTYWVLLLAALAAVVMNLTAVRSD
ncbi:MAG: hypothetical protein LBV78_08070, partial [Kitasatospora sp.]|nr:hypothetical protein [Kitasatospora sp.]